MLKVFQGPVSVQLTHIATQGSTGDFVFAAAKVAQFPSTENFGTLIDISRNALNCLRRLPHSGREGVSSAKLPGSHAARWHPHLSGSSFHNFDLRSSQQERAPNAKQQTNMRKGTRRHEEAQGGKKLTGSNKTETHRVTHIALILLWFYKCAKYSSLESINFKSSSNVEKAGLEVYVHRWNMRLMMTIRERKGLLSPTPVKMCIQHYATHLLWCHTGSWWMLLCLATWIWNEMKTW